jgi:hypothetical protein
MNSDSQIPTVEQYPPSPLTIFKLIGNVHHAILQECGISTQAGMWEQGSVQGIVIFSAPQRRGEKYVFEYFSFNNVKI